MVFKLSSSNFVSIMFFITAIPMNLDIHSSHVSVDVISDWKPPQQPDNTPRYEDLKEKIRVLKHQIQPLQMEIGRQKTTAQKVEK